MKLVVIKKFQDKETKKFYQPGTEITHFSDERAKDVIRRKLVVEVKPVLTDIDMSKGAKEVISQIADFADVEKLNGYLNAESALEKPRVTVVNAIQARLEELKK
jgi:hypothetical protein